MKNYYLKNKHYIIGAITGILIIYLFSSLIVDKRLSVVRDEFERDIQEQLLVIKDLAITTGRGGVNEYTQKNVIDCPSESRQTFETLLAKLDQGLDRSDINILNNLFPVCGQVHANRRAGMVLLLEREIVTLNNLVERRMILGDFKTDSIPLTLWQDLLQNEKKISEHFLSLVSLQKQIISGLQQGQTITSLEIESLRKKAEDIQNELIKVTESASSQRSKLTSS